MRNNGVRIPCRVCERMIVLLWFAVVEAVQINQLQVNDLHKLMSDLGCRTVNCGLES
jgi:hypothetical protein